MDTQIDNSANFTEITFTKIKTQIESYLTQNFSNAGIIYSPSSPYGQLLFVIENLFALSMLYLKNILKQFDVTDPTSLNLKSIRSAAALAGHFYGRNISATGVLVLKIKTTTDVNSDIPGGQITFTDQQLLKNKTNNLNYSLSLGTDQITYKVDSSTQIYLNIIQGTWIQTSFTGNGGDLQSFSIVPRSPSTDIENWNVIVSVNGVVWPNVVNLIDLLPNQMGVVVRSSLAGSGIDVVFGNGGFGLQPPVNANIVVNYLLSDGNSGNIYRRTPNDFQFLGISVDGLGGSLDPEKLFDIQIFNDINFGADSESIQFTKNLLPISSNNFVIATAQQFSYCIKKLGIFSYVNAYLDPSSSFLNIVVCPNISLFKNQNSNYFDINLNSFLLDSYEISKISTYLKSGQNILLNQKFSISSPTLSLYVINIYCIVKKSAQTNTIYSQINNVLSNYFLDINQSSRIPKSDIIENLLTITDLISVDCSFISKDNENYYIQNLTQLNNSKLSSTDGSFNVASQQNVINYTPNTTIGLDPILGDILFSQDSVPVLRGGWSDRNGNFYSDDNNSNGLKTVNIFITGVQ